MLLEREAQPKRKQHSDVRIPPGVDRPANCAVGTRYSPRARLPPRACVSRVGELFNLEKLVSQSTIEALRESVLPWTAWLM